MSKNLGSTLEIAARIRQKQISPLQAVEAAISAIETVNPPLNAVTETLYDEARRKAQELTKIWNEKSAAQLEQEAPALFGVPFSVKEMIAVHGALSTAGNEHYKNNRSEEDALLIQRLRHHGAIPVCTTNVPELGFWFETNNKIYGRTKNPYDHERTPGGSSGGEAALIATGAVPFGIGSDIGGSARMPAAFCGIYGHKVTLGALPIQGHFSGDTQIPDDPMPFTTMGFFSHSAKDLSVLMKILQYSQTEKPLKMKDLLQKAPSLNISSLKVLSLEDPRVFLCERTEPDLREAVTKTSRLFVELGATHEELPKDIFRHALAIWGVIVGSQKSGLTFTEKLTRGNELKLAKELFGTIRGKTFYTFPSLVTVALEKWLSKRDPPDSILQEFHGLDLYLKEKLQGAILIMPVFPTVAPLHNRPFLKPFNFLLAAIMNAFGYPALSVPMGLKKGLPLSVQLIAAPGEDTKLFAAAEIIESTFGGWIPPESNLKLDAH